MSQRFGGYTGTLCYQKAKRWIKKQKSNKKERKGNQKAKKGIKKSKISIVSILTPPVHLAEDSYSFESAAVSPTVAHWPNPLYLTPTSFSSFDIIICLVLAVFGKYGQLYLSRAHESISLLVTAPVPQPPSRHCYDLLWDPIFRRRFQIFIGCCINISNIATQTFFCSVGKVRLFFNQLSVVKYVLKISNFWMNVVGIK